MHTAVRRIALPVFELRQRRVRIALPKKDRRITERERMLGAVRSPYLARLGMTDKIIN